MDQNTVIDFALAKNKWNLAKRLEVQRMDAALDMRCFLSHAHEAISQPLTSSESDSDDESYLAEGETLYMGIPVNKNDRNNDKLRIYNLSQVKADREALQDVLLGDTESESDCSDSSRISYLLRQHVRNRRKRLKYYSNKKNAQYGYYGCGTLSKQDLFNQHQQSIVGVGRRRKERLPKPVKPRAPAARKQPQTKESKKSLAPTTAQTKWKQQSTNKAGTSTNQTPKLMLVRGPSTSTGGFTKPNVTGGRQQPYQRQQQQQQQPRQQQQQKQQLQQKQQQQQQIQQAKRARKKVAVPKTPEVMAARRRKAWILMAKKDLGKVQRAKVNNHKEVLNGARRLATICMKACRQRALQSQRNQKDSVWRAKRLTREMQAYWKRHDRVERETRRRMEKEAEEQRKMDVELIEAKRQQRKLNFLITQTELYAHFMSKKLGQGSEQEQLRILSQLDEEINPRLAAIDDYDVDEVKTAAARNACDAFTSERARTNAFDVLANAVTCRMEVPIIIDECPQPSIFVGSLKGYQIKGMTWLANLYNQGISGILADEMGLGKTVQSIAFLCHIAEKYGVWGPFLIISPASTLHNWQQEMNRFVPSFRIVPYWGSPNERKILRQFWETKDLHTQNASFHVVITSYQLVVSDFKYFNRIKWQYMVLDEAQAIKSSTSVRWKLLLGFNCRNRLLLSGTPIQNSMAELWALLHFIMPTLFDSHDEFNEWFSKDIESHAENKTGIDERQISRLHMILKPFMLRRIKKDVENELSDKIEIMVYCPLTTRQKLLYEALKKKIRIEDLLHVSDRGESQSFDKSFTSNLMNLVMQFRKVCNHPELFERRDARSPLYVKCLDYAVPRFIYDNGVLLREIPSRRHLLYNLFSIFKSEYVHRSRTSKNARQGEAFAFASLCGLSPYEIEQFFVMGLLSLFQMCFMFNNKVKKVNFQRKWWYNNGAARRVHLRTIILEPMSESKVNKQFLEHNSYFNELLFVSLTTRIYTHTTHIIHPMRETMEHRIMRSKRLQEQQSHEVIDEQVSIVDIIAPIPSILTADLLSSPIMASEANAAGTSKVVIVNNNPSGSSTMIGGIQLVPEMPYVQRISLALLGQSTEMPRFLYGLGSKVQTTGRHLYCDHRGAQWNLLRHNQCENTEGQTLVRNSLSHCAPSTGWSNILIPDKQTLVSDAGKLSVLDNLLNKLKAQGHRVLIYSQMTKMIDLLEEYMWHRKYRYMRLDGSSKISARRDMVADFQNRADIFVFLLSTRAGGLGINLTAADTVIFYDSDWNPTVDQQAMDRAHRLGQTKQVTVYRLICKGTIEERILQRAREKSEIQRMVISGGSFKPDTLKPKEVVSLLLDDEEIEHKYRQKTEERRSFHSDDPVRVERTPKRERKARVIPDAAKTIKMDLANPNAVQIPTELPIDIIDNSSPIMPTNEIVPMVRSSSVEMIDVESTVGCPPFIPDFSIPIHPIETPTKRRRHNPRGTKRGRPRGSRRGGLASSLPRVESVAGSQGGYTISQPDGSFAPAPVKRGPGRPRLKPNGPANQGYRGMPRARKPTGQLVVPLGSFGTITTPHHVAATTFATTSIIGGRGGGAATNPLFSPATFAGPSTSAPQQRHFNAISRAQFRAE